MYAVGETFYHEILDEEYELNVIGDIILGGIEYLIAEDFEGGKWAFLFDEDEEEVILMDEDEALEIITYWEKEYFGGNADIGDWDEDGYYDREDITSPGDDDEEKFISENYIEDEDFVEEDDDDGSVDSFFTNLID